MHAASGRVERRLVPSLRRAARADLRRKLITFPAAHIAALAAIGVVDGKAQAKVTRAVVRFTQAVVKE